MSVLYSIVLLYVYFCGRTYENLSERGKKEEHFLIKFFFLIISESVALVGASVKIFSTTSKALLMPVLQVFNRTE